MNEERWRRCAGAEVQCRLQCRSMVPQHARPQRSAHTVTHGHGAAAATMNSSSRLMALASSGSNGGSARVTK